MVTEMEEKNTLDAHTRNVLSTLLISESDEFLRNKEFYSYLLKKFYKDEIIKMLDIQLLKKEFQNFEDLKSLNNAIVKKLNSPKLENLPSFIIKRVREGEFEVLFYVAGFLKAKKIKDIIVEQIVLNLDKHRNRKGKQWRDKLYPLAYDEWRSNQNTDKTKALKTIFEKMSDKEEHREDFELHFKSILEKFYKYKPSVNP